MRTLPTQAQVAEETRRQKQVELEAQLAAVRQTNAELEVRFIVVVIETFTRNFFCLQKETVVALKLKASVELSAFSDRHMKTIKVSSSACGLFLTRHSVILFL